MSDILTTDRLVCGYDTALLGPLDFTIPSGAFVLIEGPNGIGKSTLLETIAGLQGPISGAYDWTVEGVVVQDAYPTKLSSPCDTTLPDSSP
ncbi:MAG: ATP-binding cassette domain-containing protein, partial [Bradymonadaceae bacterium]